MVLTIWIKRNTGWISPGKVGLSQVVSMKQSQNMAGWWFGTWMLCSPIVGMMIQSDELHHFSGGLVETTNQMGIEPMMDLGCTGWTHESWCGKRNLRAFQGVFPWFFQVLKIPETGWVWENLTLVLWYWWTEKWVFTMDCPWIAIDRCWFTLIYTPLIFYIAMFWWWSVLFDAGAKRRQRRSFGRWPQRLTSCWVISLGAMEKPLEAKPKTGSHVDLMSSEPKVLIAWWFEICFWGLVAFDYLL